MSALSDDEQLDHLKSFAKKYGSAITVSYTHLRAHET